MKKTFIKLIGRLFVVFVRIFLRDAETSFEVDGDV